MVGSFGGNAHSVTNKKLEGSRVSKIKRHASGTATVMSLQRFAGTGFCSTFHR